MSAVLPLPCPESAPASLQDWFARFREHTIGVDVPFDSPYGRQRMLYADWIASGRLYAPIEELLRHRIAPFVGNTHTETSEAGTTMTRAYHRALAVIKRHVNAGRDDAVVSYGSGMTAVVNKFQRILGLRVHENYIDRVRPPEHARPVVFVTHMEHHSNQTSWLETICEVRVIPADADGLVDLAGLDALLAEYRERPVKFASVTSCSNVTGIVTPYHEIAERMHRAGGLCFVDFAASAPYIDIDMHPAGRPDAGLDAIFFSPHKFLGGPGTPGVLIFDSALYHNRVPDQPGGGTVNWTNPWQQHAFVDDVEAREDGGTPAFLQTIKAAMAVRLKEQMGVANILAREHELRDILMPGLRAIPGVHLLADHLEDRLGIFSFYVEDMHYNLLVRLLNDRFGVQVRGGCSCAGTYGHYLLNVDPNRSRAITEKIDSGDLSDKPGWVRLSIHPTTTDDEARALVEAVRACVLNAAEWSKDYRYCNKRNEYVHPSDADGAEAMLSWFETPAAAA